MLQVLCTEGIKFLYAHVNPYVWNTGYVHNLFAGYLFLIWVTRHSIAHIFWLKLGVSNIFILIEALTWGFTQFDFEITCRGEID